MSHTVFSLAFALTLRFCVINKKFMSLILGSFDSTGLLCVCICLECANWRTQKKELSFSCNAEIPGEEERTSVSLHPSSVSQLVFVLTSKVFNFFLFFVLDWLPSNQRPPPKDSSKQIVPPPRGLFCSPRASYLLHEEHYEVRRSDLHI